MIRILHIIQSLDPAWGGIARVVPDLAAGLVAAGHSCRIATLAGGRFGAPLDIGGVEVVAFSDAGGSRLGRSAQFNSEIARLVADCEVVHLHGLWTGQNQAAGRAARKAGRPYIMTPHSMMMPWAWKRSRWKKLLAGWMFEHANLRSAAMLHALADGEAEAIRALGFNSRVTVIPNGLHTAEYAALPAPDALHARFPNAVSAKWVLMLGRVAIQKGIVPGMQACFDILAAGKDWHLVIAGPDEFGLQRMLESAIRRKGLDSRVTFTGHLSRDEVRAALGRASILLQPSLSEGLSMSILESLAAGLPVVISDACNMPEVKQADAGRIVSPNRRAIAAALKELVTLDDAARHAMGRRGKALAADCYDWRGLIPRYVSMYESVARR